MHFPAADGSRHTVVDQLSFSLSAGESVGVVGESGSGKSMTALSAMQLLPAAAQSEGSIIWRGETDLAQCNEQELSKIRGRQMGMIFQEPLSSLNPVMRCGEQIAEVLRYHLLLGAKAATQVAKDWLAKVQLRDPNRIYDAYPHQISGGQRQRVMIAMALCAEPALLIADEPTTALDVTVQYAILELVKHLQQELNIATIFISHDLAVVREITDKVMVMKEGEVLERGQVGTVFQHPQAAYTKGLLACRPPINQRLTRLATVADFTSDSIINHQDFLTELEEPEEEYTQRQVHLAQAEELLCVENLRVWYPKSKNWFGTTTEYFKAVELLSFSLRQGECLGVVGESGSGKTTLGKAILQLVPSAGGSIYLRGQKINALDAKSFRALRPKLQMVFQDPFNSLNPKLRIEQLLREPLEVHRPGLSRAEQNEEIQQILAEVDLPVAVLERYPKDFSGGQRQRIGIARALLLKPALLICDESVSALDVSVQAQVLNLIKSLQRRYGFSLIFISHDMSVIKFIADQVLVMKEGQGVELAPTEQLFAQPQAAYTRSLLAAIL